MCDSKFLWLASLGLDLLVIWRRLCCEAATVLSIATPTPRREQNESSLPRADPDIEHGYG